MVSEASGSSLKEGKKPESLAEKLKSLAEAGDHNTCLCHTWKGCLRELLLMRSQQLTKSCNTSDQVTSTTSQCCLALSTGDRLRAVDPSAPPPGVHASSVWVCPSQLSGCGCGLLCLLPVSASSGGELDPGPISLPATSCMPSLMGNSVLDEHLLCLASGCCRH